MCGVISGDCLETSLQADWYSLSVDINDSFSVVSTSGGGFVNILIMCCNYFQVTKFSPVLQIYLIDNQIFNNNFGIV